MIGNTTQRISYGRRHIGLIKIILAAIALSGIALGFFYFGKRQSLDQLATSAVVPVAARVDQVDGEVGISSQPIEQTTQNTAYSNNSKLNNPNDNNGYVRATINSPVSVGDRIYVRDSSHAGIAFGEKRYARLDPGASLDVETLTAQQTQLALRNGSGTFDIGDLSSGDLFEVETPGGAVDFLQPGLYQVGIDDNGNTVISTLSGLARVVGPSGTCDIAKGESLTLNGPAQATTVNQPVLSHLAPALAGHIVDDYYHYRCPRTYDGRYADYNTYLYDPTYYEPYRQSASYKYVDQADYIAGVDDLDTYGEWQEVAGHGRCWHPRVESNWAPYQDGYWAQSYPWGLTWVSNERWGWAPYHYGRWTCVNNEWFWAPGGGARQVYSPALVAFVSFSDRQEVGWVPLGPGDAYVPRYYNRNWQPQYIGNRSDVNLYVNAQRTANFNSPGAVTVVAVANFNRSINQNTIVRGDPGSFARTRPVADPLAVAEIRQQAFSGQSFRSRVDVPAAVAQRINERNVVASQAAVLPPSMQGRDRSLRVEQVSADQTRQRMQVRNEAQPIVATQPNGLPARGMAGSNVQGGISADQARIQQERQARITQLAPQAARGDRTAAREMQQLQAQQRTDVRNAQQPARQAQNGQPVSPTPAQQQDPRQQRAAQQEAARQQAQIAQQQRQSQRDQQAQQRQAARQQATDQGNARAAQQAQLRQQQQQAAAARRQDSQNRQNQMAQERQQAQEQARQRQQQRAQQQPTTPQPQQTNAGRKVARPRIPQQATPQTPPQAPPPQRQQARPQQQAPPPQRQQARPQQAPPPQRQQAPPQQAPPQQRKQAPPPQAPPQRQQAQPPQRQQAPPPAKAAPPRTPPPEKKVPPPSGR